MLPKKEDVLAMYNKVSNRVKQYALNMTPLEIKVDEATNNEPWGPHGTAMAEISRAAYDYESYKEIMGVIARRLQSEGENWRHVYKSLLLLEYLSKHGPQKVVDELSSNLTVVERLQRFEYQDKNGRDWGLNVRQRAKELTSLVGDPDRIRRERQKAKQNESKYTGVSADESRMGGFGFGNSSSGFGSSNPPRASPGFASSRRYEDDTGLDYAEDQDEVDAKEATRRRIESLKKSAPVAESAAPRVSPAKISNPLQPPEPESRGPKRLSQVKVNPNIAMSLGVPSRPADPPPPRPAAAQSAASPILDLFDEPAPAASAPSAAPTNQGADVSWDAFAGATAATPAPAKAAQQDDWASLLEGGNAATASSAAAAADPFAALTGGGGSGAAAADPFASFVAPAPPKPDQDPFALLTNPAPKAQSPLKAAGASPESSANFFDDPFSTAAPAKQGSATSTGLGSALPEDMFSMPQQPSFATPQVRVGTVPPSTAGSGSLTHALGGSPIRSGASPARGQPSSSGFGDFSSAPATAASTEDLFASMSFSNPSGAAAEKEALGGGQKMAPNLPQPKLPPPVVKADPFAGLAGF